MVGPGDLDALDDEIPERLRDRVRALGPVAEADKPGAYASADVFVAPNLGGESFGIVLLEAMAAGVPVLASDLEAFHAVLDGGRAGALFRVGDSDDLAAAASALLDDPDRQAALVAAGPKRRATLRLGHRRTRRPRGVRDRRRARPPSPLPRLTDRCVGSGASGAQRPT